MDNAPFFIIPEVPPRRVLTLFYIVDISGSKADYKMAALNSALSDSIPIVSDISNCNPDASIKLAVLKSSSECEWMYPSPGDIDDFKWKDLKADHSSSLADTFHELSQKLSAVHGFMNNPSGSYAPMIILISDRGSVESESIGRSLLKLHKNNWFKAASKIAIAFGDEASKERLIDFTSSAEAVITIHNVDDLRTLVRLIAANAIGRVRATMPDIITEITKNPTLKGVDIGMSTLYQGTDIWEI